MSTNYWLLKQNINNWRFWIGKNNLLFNRISHQPDIDKTYLYAKDLYEAKYVTNEQQRKHLNDFKVVIEYSNHIDDIYKNIEKYNPSKENKTLIVFDDMIADILINKT